MANNGNEKAEKELEKWEKVAEDFRAEIMLEMSPEEKEYVKKIKEKYN